MKGEEILEEYLGQVHMDAKERKISCYIRRNSILLMENCYTERNNNNRKMIKVIYHVM